MQLVMQILHIKIKISNMIRYNLFLILKYPCIVGSKWQDPCGNVHVFVKMQITKMFPIKIDEFL